MNASSFKYSILVTVAALYLIGGIFFTILLMLSSITLFQYIALHLIGVSFSSLLYPLYLTTRSPFVPIFWLFNATLGIIGSFLFLLLLLLFSVYGYILDPLQKLMEAILPHISHTRGEVVYERIRYGLEFAYKDTSALPFNDVMHYGSTQQKITAIGKILRFFNPVFSETLRIAAADMQGSVRVMAATAISYLDESYFKKFRKLEDEAKSAKDKREALILLAHHAEEYSHCLFFDESRRVKMRGHAIKAYRDYLDLEPVNSEAKERLAALLNEDGRPNEAEELLIEELNGAASINKRLYIELMNAYLKQKKYEEMRRLTEKYYEPLSEIADKEDPGIFDELFHTWSLQIQTERMMRGVHEL